MGINYPRGRLIGTDLQRLDSVGLFGFTGPHEKKEKQLKQHIFKLIFIRVGLDSLVGGMWPPFEYSYELLNGGPKEKKTRIVQPVQKVNGFS